MWLYLGIFSVVITVLAWYKPSPNSIITYTKSVLSIGGKVCKVIRKNRLKWTRQMITNQLSIWLIEIKPRHYIIHYPFGVNWYKIIVVRHRGPCKIDTVTDHNGMDVTKDIFAYMGPGHNFHEMRVTPTLLGYKKLVFTFINTETKTFIDTEQIIL